MSTWARKNAFFVFFIFLTGLIYIPKLFLADSTLYTEVLTDRPLALIGSLSRLLFLFYGFYLAWGAGSIFERDNPVRPAWRLLAWGILSYSLGQFVLVIYQLLFSAAAPYPSLGDVFFLLAMALWLFSLGVFVRAYTHAGFMEGGAGRAVIVALAVAALLGVVGYAVLIPVLESSAPAMEKILNIAYPVSDLLVMIPVLVLLQMAFKLRGGTLWRPWAALLAGFIFLTLGDILFAYFTTLEKELLDPLIDVMFTSSYIFIAWGASLQKDIR